MCFTAGFSLGVFLIEMGIAVSLWKYDIDVTTAVMLGYFSLMELLQFFDYFVLADTLDGQACNTPGNQWLNVLGVLHICWQPFVVHACRAVDFPRDTWALVVGLVQLGCIVDTMAYMLGHFGLTPDFNWESCMKFGGAPSGGPWLVSKASCMAEGSVHMKWAMRAPPPSYYWTGSLHSFLFFAPFFFHVLLPAKAERKESWWHEAVRGVLLLLSGPLFGSWISGFDRYEAAGIWCLHNYMNFILLGLITYIMSGGKSPLKADLEADALKPLVAASAQSSLDRPRASEEGGVKDDA